MAVVAVVSAVIEFPNVFFLRYLRLHFLFHLYIVVYIKQQPLHVQNCAVLCVCHVETSGIFFYAFKTRNVTGVTVTMLMLLHSPLQGEKTDSKKDHEKILQTVISSKCRAPTVAASVNMPL